MSLFTMLFLKILMVLGIITDITQRKQAEQVLTEFGYKVIVTRNGVEIINPYDLSNLV